MTDDAEGGDSGDLLVLPSQLTRMGEARRWVSARAAAAGFDERAVWDLELALTEALSNVIRHSYDDQEDREIRLTMTVDEDKLTVVVRAFGKKFSRSAYQRNDRDPDRPGGYGVGMIEQVMDEVEWDDSPECGTLLRLAKYRPGRPAQLAGGETGGQ